MVKMVDEELKMEVREDMRAANITASIIPRAPERYLTIHSQYVRIPPVGMSSVTSFTKAMLVQPLLLLQILMHSSGWAQATSSVKRTLAAIPGKIMMKRGRSLR